MASGYGSRTLTYSAAHVLDSSKDHSSSLLGEASPSVDGRAPVEESLNSGTQITTLTGSNLHLEKVGVLQRRKDVTHLTAWQKPDVLLKYTRSYNHRNTHLSDVKK